MAFTTRQLGDGFAAEIQGVDLAADINEATFTALCRTWMENKVVVLRGQKLDDGAMMRFSRRFGELFVHVRKQFHSPEHPEVLLISNLEQDGRPIGALGHEGLAWHSDQAYTAKRVFGTLLYAVEIPEAGGNTLFADLAQAYAALPAARQADLSELETIYSIEVTTKTEGLPLPNEQRQATPDVVHSLVRRHPHLARQGLYLSPAHTLAIRGMAAADSDALLSELAAWASQDRFIYEHEWAEGDVIIWDNTHLMHTQRPFNATARRLLRRTGWYYANDAGEQAA